MVPDFKPGPRPIKNAPRRRVSHSALAGPAASSSWGGYARQKRPVKPLAFFLSSGSVGGIRPAIVAAAQRSVFCGSRDRRESRNDHRRHRDPRFSGSPPLQKLVPDERLACQPTPSSLWLPISALGARCDFAAVRGFPPQSRPTCKQQLLGEVKAWSWLLSWVHRRP